MGTAHGGLRQKNFNFDEESIRVPLASHVDLPRPPNHVVSIRERRNKDREYRRLRRMLTYVGRTRLKPLG